MEDGCVPDIEFEGELLIPRLNVVAYRHIYVFENWLRRICLAGWMAQHGSDWPAEIAPALHKRLLSRVTHNQKRLYLGAESHDDLIWQATHAELSDMLAEDSVAESIKKLTGVSGGHLKKELSEVREVRNLLAHNRAFSEKTLRLLDELLASLDQVVQAFKHSVLYGESDILSADSQLGGQLADLLVDNDWSRFQAFVARSGEFIQYVSLPVERDSADWPDAQRLLQVYDDCLDGIISFCLNKSGSEYTILTPRVLPSWYHSRICATFARNPEMWTTTRFEEQEIRYVTSPKIWFYEKASPFGVDQRPF